MVERKCIACGEIKNRDNLIKITRENSRGDVVINPDSKIFGRSAYLCYNQMCIVKSFKKNKLNKALKTSQELKGLFNNGEYQS